MGQISGCQIADSRMAAINEGQIIGQWVPSDWADLALAEQKPRLTEWLNKSREFGVYRCYKRGTFYVGHHSIVFGYCANVTDEAQTVSRYLKAEVLLPDDCKDVRLKCTGAALSCDDPSMQLDAKDWCKDKIFAIETTIKLLEKAVTSCFRQECGDYHLIRNNCQMFADRMLNTVARQFGLDEETRKFLADRAKDSRKSGRFVFPARPVEDLQQLEPADVPDLEEVVEVANGQSEECLPLLGPITESSAPVFERLKSGQTSELPTSVRP